MPEHVCQNCGTTWRRPPTRGQVPKWCTDCRTYSNGGRKRPSACITCGVATGDMRCVRCKACADAYRRSARRQLVVYTGPRHIQPESIATAGHISWRSGQCRICQTWFTTWNVDVTCSPECHKVYLRQARHRNKAKRRAVKRDAYVADVYRHKVFKADGYRCHICRRKTDPTKRVPHPKAPTIDHVIPLAKGGTHEPANCRTACFACNTVKSDGGGGEQMLLIAV